jgi:hypothetical protein
MPGHDHNEHSFMSRKTLADVYKLPQRCVAVPGFICVHVADLTNTVACTQLFAIQNGKALRMGTLAKLFRTKLPEKPVNIFGNR